MQIDNVSEAFKKCMKKFKKWEEVYKPRLERLVVTPRQMKANCKNTHKLNMFSQNDDTNAKRQKQQVKIDIEDFNLDESSSDEI